MQNKINQAYWNNGGGIQNGHPSDDWGQFSKLRYAFLFKPGTYPLDVPVGFYTQVVGLGKNPSDTVLTVKEGYIVKKGHIEPQ